MPDQLPRFPYHPDPVSTGSVAPSGSVCVCCSRARGYSYQGPVFAEDDLRGRLCPWCIADGSAAARFDAHFIGDPLGEDVPREVVLAVDSRTPGFLAWQDPRWFFHCGDGAAFLGRAGAAELAGRPGAWEALRSELATWEWPPEQVEQFLGSLEKDGQPTAYLFRCRGCAALLAYADHT
jgi:uncharacterized protein